MLVQRCVAAFSPLLLGIVVLAQPAQAISISLVQVGGTYDGIFAQAGDTLVLEVIISLAGDPSIGVVDPAIDYEPATATLSPGLGLEIGMNSCCSSLSPLFSVAVFTQLALFDIGEVAPGHVRGYGMRSIGGAKGSGSFSPGKIGLTLTGLSGTISTSNTVGRASGTSILDADGNDITSTATLGGFEVHGALVPEPSTLLLVAFGLLALARRPTSGCS